jgi:hypothetical protein
MTNPGAGSCHTTPYNGNGYTQVELNPLGFTNSQTITTTTNVIPQVVPLIIIVAVVGIVVGMLKKFKLWDESLVRSPLLQLTETPLRGRN